MRKTLSAIVIGSSLGGSIGWISPSFGKAHRSAFTVQSDLLSRFGSFEAQPQPNTVETDLLSSSTQGSPSSLGIWAQFLEQKEKMLQRLAGSSPDDLPKIVQELDGTSDAFLRRSLRESVYLKWAETNPLAAIAFLENYPGGNQLGNFLSAWVKTDSKGALEWAINLPIGGRLSNRVRPLLEALAQNQPAMVLKNWHQLPASMATTELASSLMDGLADQNPELAAKESSQLPKSHQMAAASGLAKRWASRDFDTALAWANSLTDSTIRDQVNAELLKGLAISDPLRAKQLRLEQTLDISQTSAKATDLAIGAALSQKNAEQALQWVAQSQHVGAKEVSEFVQKHYVPRATIEPTAAQLVETSKTITSITGDLAHVHVSSANPEQLLDDLQNLPSSPERHEVELDLFKQLVERDLDSALDRSRNTSAQQQEKWNLVLIDRINRSPDLERWSQIIPRLEPIRQVEAAERMGATVGAKAPELIEKFAQAAPSAPIKDALVRGFIPEAVKIAPEQAVQAVSYVSNQDASMHLVAREWAHNDPMQASVWVAELPQGHSRDLAIAAFSNSISRGLSSEEAIAWANSIGDPEMRREAVEQLHSYRSAPPAWREPRPIGSQ